MAKMINSNKNTITISLKTLIETVVENIRTNYSRSLFELEEIIKINGTEELKNPCNEVTGIEPIFTKKIKNCESI